MNKLLYNKKGMYISIAILFLFYLALLYFTRFQMASKDEAYYYAIPFRLIQGDVMFLEAWELHQTSAVIMMPIVYLYHLFVPDFTGLLLFMRMVFISVQFVIGLFIFQILRYRFQNLSAFLVTFLFMNAVSFLIPAFSYNTMPILFSALMLALVFSNPQSKYYNLKLFIAGAIFVLIVPAYPTLIIMFIPLAIVCIGVFFVKKKWVLEHKKQILYFIAGMFLSTILYLSYFLMTSSFHYLIENYSKMQDSYHPSKGLIYPFKLFVKQLFESLAMNHSNLFRLGSMICLLGSILLAVMYRFLLKSKWKDVYFIGSIVLLMFVIFIQVNGIINSDLRMQSQMNYFALPCLMMLPTIWMLNFDKKSTVFMLVTVSISFSISLVIQYGSTTELQGASAPFILCAIPVLGYLIDDLLKFKAKKKVMYISYILVFVSLFYYVASMTIHQLTKTFESGDRSNCTTRIEVGPSKGLYGSQEAVEYETGKFNFIKEYLPQDGYALFLDETPEGYLTSDLRVSAQSVWTNADNVSISQQYYKEHMERLPNFLYISSNEFFINQDIYDNFEQHNAEIHESEYGKIYVFEN